RDFLDNVVTSTLVLEGDGRLGEYVGGYSDWLRQRPSPAAAAAATAKAEAGRDAVPAATAAPAPAQPPKAKRSFRDTRELEQLPARIERLETEIARRGAAMNDPAFFRQDADT